jgi:hypothetical protein
VELRLPARPAARPPDRNPARRRPRPARTWTPSRTPP